MIPFQIYKTRIKKLTKSMQPKSTCILFAPNTTKRNNDVFYPYRTSSHLLYLTGLNLDSFAIVIKKTGEVYLFFSEATLLEQQWEGERISQQDLTRIFQISSEHIFTYDKLWKALPKILDNSTTLYYDFGENSTVDRKLLQILQRNIKLNRLYISTPHQILHINTLISEMRLKKDKFEISQIQKACEISSYAHNSLIQYVKEYFHQNPHESLSERVLKAKLESFFGEKGALEIAYPSIVASGHNTTILHYTDCNKRFKASDCLLIDAGCEYQSYASDITRSFIANGHFTGLYLDIYMLVLETQKDVIKYIQSNAHKEKISLEKVHQLTVKKLIEGLIHLKIFKKIPYNNKWVHSPSYNEIIDKKIYQLFYMHKTSHYMGLDVHDTGSYYIRRNKPRKIEHGMVFTVEPGLYFSKSYSFLPKSLLGVGIRIEDDIWVHPNGADILTHNSIKEVSEIQNI